jgi:hypothetical protein
MAHDKIKFVDEWICSRDRIKALEAGGYQTANKISAGAQFRRLMQSEDVKAAISSRDIESTGQTQAEIDKAIRICWEMINGGGREASTFMGHLLKLKGWDKSTKDMGESPPPIFQNMPFTPNGCTSTVPE